MKRLSLMSLIILMSLVGIVSALIFASPAASFPPTQITEYVDMTLKSNSWTRRCGFPVYIHQQGKVASQLFYSPDGTQVVSEIDTTAGYSLTYFSPLLYGGTGGSYTAVSADALRTTYPDGTDLGAPAFLAFNGLQAIFPGLPQAGRDFWLGEVVFITDDGLPLADLVAPISSQGHFSDFADIIAALCGKLAMP